MPALEYLSWIKDKLTQAILYKRIRQVGEGQFGKTRHVGNGIFEMKIDFGPGYRVYFGIHIDEIILILLAGSKNTQEKDIKKAWRFWNEDFYERKKIDQL